MGLYDREYTRDEEQGFHVSAPSTITTKLLLITVAAYLAQLAFPQVTNAFALKADWFRRPWEAFELLTYGFLHDPTNISHILLNMLVFWMFGREIELRYGRREFLVFYLLAIVAAGLVWSASEMVLASNEPHGFQFGVSPQGQIVLVRTGLPPLVGASGGIAAVFALFALNFPHRQVLFMFILPMPMWVAALIALAFDISGAIERTGNVAFAAHLGGAAFGLAYYKLHWSLSKFVERPMASLSARGRPKLRVHDPQDAQGGDDLSKQVDEILQKIQDHGQDSLTWSERRVLEKASRQYQQKRK